MNWNIVWAIVIRHLYNFKHSWDRITDAFYWPAIDIILWGFASVAIAQRSSSLSNIVIVLLSGIILWMIVWRGQYEITVNLLEEMWNQNMVNLFASPLRIREWITGVFIVGIIKMSFTVCFAIILALLVYHVNLFSLGLYLIPFMISLLITGWASGMLVAALIVYFGTRIQTLAWSGVAIITPFSGVFYPISTLPEWAQKVSAFLPTSYIFEGMRSIIINGSFSWSAFWISFVLNFVYIIIGILLFVFMFEQSRKKGFARLD